MAGSRVFKRWGGGGGQDSISMHTYVHKFMTIVT